MATGFLIVGIVWSVAIARTNKTNGIKTSFQTKFVLGMLFLVCGASALCEWL